MNNYQGAFVWYDLMTLDVGAAKEFYTGLFDWGLQDWEGPSPYSMWTVGDSTIGGVTDLPEEAKGSGVPPHWIGYVGTDDVETTLKKATELGGQVIHPSTEIPETGTFGIIADPQGGVMGVYCPADPSKMEGPSEAVGHFSWHEHMALDMDPALNFYTSLFGWTKGEGMDMGESGMYQMYGLGERTLGGMMKKPAEIPGPSIWIYYVTVSDILASIEKVKSRGGAILHGPMEVPGGGQVASCADPQGAAFAMYMP